MPSPVGHMLGGALAGGAVAGRSTGAAPWWRDALLFGVLAILPDLDLLFGVHSQRTHSVGAACIVGLAALAVSRGRWRWALAVAAAYASHVLLDAFGSDDTPPLGVLAFWPFSDAFYQADAHLFPAITRRYWLPEFWQHNLRALAREVALLGPPTALVWWWRSRRGGARRVVKPAQ